jgi:hypothetical protein
MLFLSGCAKQYPHSVMQNRLNIVYIGLLNHDQWYGSLPSVNSNTWRFSNSTNFKLVSWRCCVLESIEGLGFPKDGSRNFDIERQINSAGIRAFECHDMRIVLNPKIAGLPFSDIPAGSIIAFWWPIKPATLWYSDDVLTIDELPTIDNNKNNTMALFVDGTVGFVSFDEAKTRLSIP